MTVHTRTCGLAALAVLAVLLFTGACSRDGSTGAGTGAASEGASDTTGVGGLSASESDRPAGVGGASEPVGASEAPTSGTTVPGIDPGATSGTGSAGTAGDPGTSGDNGKAPIGGTSTGAGGTAPGVDGGALLAGALIAAAGAVALVRHRRPQD